MSKTIKPQTAIDEKPDNARWGELMKDGGKAVMDQAKKDNAERDKGRPGSDKNT